ncbi:hypothetical protein [Bradyrhizobium sp. CCGE-LA001]|uniref:hypothetical protein n=1 Tax=Bradyrhizobium sp. CCGE-LA001 TaxID=1223566 RepID=UPI0011982537|nr:hypothetical protein [Bradyrhizobium sp. CCGE-LA001]
MQVIVERWTHKPLPLHLERYSPLGWQAYQSVLGNISLAAVCIKPDSKTKAEWHRSLMASLKLD